MGQTRVPLLVTDLLVSRILLLFTDVLVQKLWRDNYKINCSVQKRAVNKELSLWFQECAAASKLWDFMKYSKPTSHCKRRVFILILFVMLTHPYFTATTDVFIHRYHFVYLNCTYPEDWECLKSLWYCVPSPEGWDWGSTTKEEHSSSFVFDSSSDFSWRPSTALIYITAPFRWGVYTDDTQLLLII